MSGSIYSRRLEDRIPELSAKLMRANDGEFETALSELQSAVAELTLRMQNRTSVAILSWPDFPHDRRKLNNCE